MGDQHAGESVGLDAIDPGPLEELTAIQKDLDVLAERLRLMEERKDKVADAVYLRVRGDYEGQRVALEQRAAPLRAKGREEYARLRALLARCDADHAAIALDREEIEFRFALGEFDEAEHKRRLKSIEASLREKADAKAAAEAMKGRFVAAFGGEDALESPVGAETAAPPPPPAAPPVVETTQRMQVLQEPPSTPPPAPAPAEVGATQVMRTLKGDLGAPPRADQTMILRTARLVPQNPEAGKQNITLALKPMSIGSDPGCDVRVAGTAAQHAEIRVSMAGFTVSDLGGGLRVNGVALPQHLLRHDDVVEIGPARFAFREG